MWILCVLVVCTVSLELNKKLFLKNPYKFKTDSDFGTLEEPQFIQRLGYQIMSINLVINPPGTSWRRYDEVDQVDQSKTHPVPAHPKKYKNISKYNHRDK